MTHCCETLQTMLFYYFLQHKYLEVLFGKSGAYNLNIQLNLYRAKIWCILLKERSQRLTSKFTSSTELNRNSPLTVNSEKELNWL